MDPQKRLGVKDEGLTTDFVGVVSRNISKFPYKTLVAPTMPDLMEVYINPMHEQSMKHISPKKLV